MSRLILLLILATWFLAAEEVRGSARPRVGVGNLALFLGGYLILVGAFAVWSRRLTGRIGGPDLHVKMRRFHRVMGWARWVVPAWLAFGLFGPARWAQVVTHWTRIGRFDFQLPGLLLGTLPPLLTWMGLWWAQYPSERSAREQEMLRAVNCGRPVHEPPTLVRFLWTSFRQQLLSVVGLAFVIVFLRDVSVHLIPRRISAEYGELLTLPSTLGVLVFSPVLLRWVLGARRLGPSPLRDRLEMICRRAGLKYRDILLWHTDHSMANAAVIGMLPGLRYVLLSDQLLETMNDQQIEAVFAHELGHIVHMHMPWLVLVFVTMILFSLGPAQMLDSSLGERARALGVPWVIVSAAVMGVFVVVVGYLMRRFERQADVFAARMMESDWGGLGIDAEGSEGGAARAPAKLKRTTVGPRGARAFGEALSVVAEVNNIAPETKDFFHPSISRRLKLIDDMSQSPERTHEFDALMKRLYATLLVALVVAAIGTGVVAWREYHERGGPTAGTWAIEPQG